MSNLNPLYKIFVVGVLLLALAGCASDNKHVFANGFEYDFGILSSRDGNITLTKETLDIPIISSDKDPHYGFGYIITSTKGLPFSHGMTLTMPHHDDVVAREGVKLESTDNKTRVYFPEKMWLGGKYIMFMAFDKGDPEGEYSFDILVDGKIKRKIAFNMFYPKH